MNVVAELRPDANALLGGMSAEALQVLVIAGAGFWVATMIALPLRYRFGGAGARESALQHAVLGQVALVLVLVASVFTAGEVLRVLVGVPLMGLLVEMAGTRSGLPFGEYSYTERLKPQVFHVPLAIPAAWFMMMPSSWAVAAALTGRSNGAVFVLVSAAAFTAWDMLLDPRMVGWGYWQWKKPGLYPGGIPISNFAGWYLSAAAMTALLAPRMPIPGVHAPIVLMLVGVYLVVWVLETLGQAVFWGMPRSAVSGGLVMGAIGLAACFAIQQSW